MEHIGVTTLTFQGHVTSSVTWPLDSGWVISYWWFLDPSLYLQPFPSDMVGSKGPLIYSPCATFLT